MVDQSAGADGEFKRGWPIVLAGCIGFGLGMSGLPFYTTGVFLDPLMHAFGWKTAQVQSGLLVLLWSTVVLAPSAGWAVERFGARRVAMISVVLFGLGFMSNSLVGSNLLQFQLIWLATAIGGAGTLPVVWGRVVNAQFHKRRGLALGMVLAGTGFTGFLAPPAASALINALGWRAAYAILGALPILIGLPIIAFGLKDQPKPGASDGPVLTHPGANLADALRSPRFWLIAVCIAVVAAGGAGCVANLVKIPIPIDQCRPRARK
jgi:MFS family permease